MSNPTDRTRTTHRGGRRADRTHRGRPVSEPATEVIGSPTAITEAVEQSDERHTAPLGFDGSTQKIDTPPDPETEVFAPPSVGAAPQVIPAREEPPRPSATGW